MVKARSIELNAGLPAEWHALTNTDAPHGTTLNLEAEPGIVLRGSDMGQKCLCQAE